MFQFLKCPPALSALEISRHWKRRRFLGLLFPFFGRVEVAAATGVHYLLNVLSTSILFLIAKVISIVMGLIMVPKCYLKHSKRSQTARSDYSASRSSNTAHSLFDVVSRGIVRNELDRKRLHAESQTWYPFSGRSSVVAPNTSRLRQIRVFQPQRDTHPIHNIWKHTLRFPKPNTTSTLIYSTCVSKHQNLGCFIVSHLCSFPGDTFYPHNNVWMNMCKWLDKYWKSIIVLRCLVWDSLSQSHRSLDAAVHCCCCHNVLPFFVPHSMSPNDRVSH